MLETVLITGSNGFVAKHLATKLSGQYNIRFLTRSPKRENEYLWDVTNKKIDVSVFENLDHIIHLAGANIFEKRWTDERKKEIISSRVESAQLILDNLKQQNKRIKTFVSASAIGYYGAITSAHVFTETDNHGNDFLSEVVVQWEQAADAFLHEDIAERVVKIRTSVVFAKEGSALDHITKSIKNYIGAPLGSGNQYMPWIHIDDLCNVYEYALKNLNMNGAYNAASAQHITNKELTKYLAKKLHKPLWLPNIPAFLLRFILGESACMILEGSRVSSQKLLDAGFVFQYPDLSGFL